MTDDMGFDLKLPAVGELTFPQWQDWLARYNTVLGERADRIATLEAALREIASVSKVYVANGDDMAQALTTLLWSHRKIAIAALEGKDD